MKFEFKKVSIGESVDGDYCQVMFHNDENTDDEPYFLIQRQFEDYDGGLCYFESHHTELSGHSVPHAAILSQDMLKLVYGGKNRIEVEITFDQNGVDDAMKLRSILSNIIPDIKVVQFE